MSKRGKQDMIHNRYMPKIEVDPETDQDKTEGQLVACEPTKVLPMVQRYLLF